MFGTRACMRLGCIRFEASKLTSPVLSTTFRSLRRVYACIEWGCNLIHTMMSARDISDCDQRISQATKRGFKANFNRQARCRSAAIASHSSAEHSRGGWLFKPSCCKAANELHEVSRKSWPRKKCLQNIRT